MGDYARRRSLHRFNLLCRLAIAQTVKRAEISKLTVSTEFGPVTKVSKLFGRIQR